MKHHFKETSMSRRKKIVAGTLVVVALGLGVGLAGYIQATRAGSSKPSGKNDEGHDLMVGLEQYREHAAIVGQRTIGSGGFVAFDQYSSTDGEPAHLRKSENKAPADDADANVDSDEKNAESGDDDTLSEEVGEAGAPGESGVANLRIASADVETFNGAGNGLVRTGTRWSRGGMSGGSGGSNHAASSSHSSNKPANGSSGSNGNQGSNNPGNTQPPTQPSQTEPPNTDCNVGEPGTNLPECQTDEDTDETPTTIVTPTDPVPPKPDVVRPPGPPKPDVDPHPPGPPEPIDPPAGPGPVDPLPNQPVTPPTQHVDPMSVPEPATLGLMGLALAALGLRRRRN